jgi:hypothetical protein
MMKRVGKVDNVNVLTSATMQLDGKSYHDHDAKLHGVKEHLKCLFSLGMSHAGEKRVAVRVAVATGLAAAMARLSVDDIVQGIEYSDKGKDIEFTVAKKGGDLEGKYTLNLSKNNGYISFMLSDEKNNVAQNVFSCRVDDLDISLARLRTVSFLHDYDKGRCLPDFLTTVQINFENAQLQDVNLRGLYLENANFKNAKLMHADLSGAYMANANMKEACINCAIMVGTRIANVNWDGVDLTNVDTNRTIL